MTRSQLDRRLDRLEAQAPRGGAQNTQAIRRGVEVIFRRPEAMEAAWKYAEVLERIADRGEDPDDPAVIERDPEARAAGQAFAVALEHAEQAHENTKGAHAS